MKRVPSPHRGPDGKTLAGFQTNEAFTENRKERAKTFRLVPLRPRTVVRLWLKPGGEGLWCRGGGGACTALGPRHGRARATSPTDDDHRGHAEVPAGAGGPSPTGWGGRGGLQGRHESVQEKKSSEKRALAEHLLKLCCWVMIG